MSNVIFIAALINSIQDKLLRNSIAVFLICCLSILILSPLALFV